MLCYVMLTYFLYIIRYNNISRPVHDLPNDPLRPPRPPSQNLEGRDLPNTPGFTPLTVSYVTRRETGRRTERQIRLDKNTDRHWGRRKEREKLEEITTRTWLTTE